MSTTTLADGVTINPAADMDAVTLRVGDMELMSSYYEKVLALTPIEEKSHGNEAHRVLGRNGVPFVRLVATPGLPGVDPSKAGLYHTAFLFDTPSALAATLYRAARDNRSIYAGSGDHLVSEAFYFTDPEGNGIELYIDRPREEWTWVDGQVQMATLFLDPNEYLRQHLTEDSMNLAPTMAGKVGHVHLQVGDIPTARDFYVDALGFESTLAFGSQVLFASAGGYHHHVAMNTWNSAGSGPRAATLGLGNVAITVPGREDLDALVARLKNKKLSFADNGTSVVTTDPWNTQVSISLPGVSTEELLDR
ncbi:VOC family protein [Flaviflexus massiliensis]|uniref:VOC family protein n=1 Tax=Flaviflexus massiliensis TaxID=1522309 RepID=UPI000AB0A2D0|nr:VOC family protein [Flaviflexus massiliensis]